MPCLIGQPVALGGGDEHPAAALRICAGARLVPRRGRPTRRWRAGICSASSAMSVRRRQDSSGCWRIVDGLDYGARVWRLKIWRLKLWSSKVRRRAAWRATPARTELDLRRLTTMAFGGIDLRPLRDQLISKVAAGTAGRRRGARSVADRPAPGRQAGGNGHSGGGARLSSAVPVALFGRKSRNCAFWRSRPRSIWAATRRSSSCWKTPGSSCRRSTSSPASNCRNRCPTMTSRS